MPRDEERPVQQSVLDRLIVRTTDAPDRLSRAQSVRDLKTAVRRDLEWLLNTRSIAVPPPEVADGGAPHRCTPTDWATSPRSAPTIPGRARGCAQMIEESISVFEPRLIGVQVTEIAVTCARGAPDALLHPGLAQNGSQPGARVVRYRARSSPRDSTRSRGNPVRDDLLEYYERELTYLRHMGAEFAARYPKVASRLLLEPTKCEDPHVERLLEGFAFLAARVHLKIDDDLPEISQSLLELVYPHYVRPIPSMSVVQFHSDPEQGKLTTGFQIPREVAALFAAGRRARRASSGRASTPRSGRYRWSRRNGRRRSGFSPPVRTGPEVGGGPAPGAALLSGHHVSTSCELESLRILPERGEQPRILALRAAGE